MFPDCSCTTAVSAVWSPDCQPTYYADRPFVNGAYTQPGSTWRVVGTAHPSGRVCVGNRLLETFRLVVGDRELAGLYVKDAKTFRESDSWSAQQDQPLLATRPRTSTRCAHHIDQAPHSPLQRPRLIG